MSGFFPEDQWDYENPPKVVEPVKLSKEQELERSMRLAGLTYNTPVQRQKQKVVKWYKDVRFVVVHYSVGWVLWQLCRFPLFSKKTQNKYFHSFQWWCFNHNR